MRLFYRFVFRPYFGRVSRPRKVVYFQLVAAPAPPAHSGSLWYDYCVLYRSEHCVIPALPLTLLVGAGRVRAKYLESAIGHGRRAYKKPVFIAREGYNRLTTGFVYVI